MSRYIVLNTDQKQYLQRVIADQRNLFPEYCAVEPIAIKNQLWILPEACLSDPNYAAFAQWLGSDLNNLTIREVNEEEYNTQYVDQILN